MAVEAVALFTCILIIFEEGAEARLLVVIRRIPSVIILFFNV
jgi:hypothetical protein